MERAGDERTRTLIEISLSTVASVRQAFAGGADRVELCSHLSAGGVTPSVGAIAAAREAADGELVVLVRPRPGDFVYDRDEADVMLRDVVAARGAGADGVAIGALTPDGQIDVALTRRLVDAAGELVVTFHRGFDATRDLARSLEVLVELGVRRVLTSGGAPSVAAGASSLADLVERAAGRIAIVPAGGVAIAASAELVRETGVRDLHVGSAVTSPFPTRVESSLRLGPGSSLEEREDPTVDAAKVRALREALARRP